MKPLLKKAILPVVMSLLFIGAPVFAQATSAVLPDSQIAQIRANCQSALATLGQIHANDAPDYINRNQTYFSISDKLMARLNSRLTLNRYDATVLVKTASDYNDQLTQFRALYQAYDSDMGDALHTDCSKDPMGFYDKVTIARNARQSVRDSIDKLTSLINQYQQNVQSFETQHFSESKS